MAKLKMSLHNIGKNMKLEQLMNEHLEDCRARGLSEYTIKSYSDNARYVLQYLDGETEITEINNQLIAQLIRAIQSTGVKASTVNNRVRYLKALFNFAYDNDYMDKLRIKAVKMSQENKNPLNEQEVKKLLRKPTGDDYCEYRQWVIVNLVLATGIRTRNVIEARVSDLDLNANILTLKDTKGRREQKIYLSASIRAILKEWIRLTGIKGDMALFPTIEGKPMNRYTYRSAFDKYVARRDVKCTPHQLRHTFTKQLVLQNVSPFVIKELLGHQDISVTQKYVKMFSEELQEQVNEIDTLSLYNNRRMKLK
ncbi:MAG: integrase [Malazfec virus 1]